MSKLFVNIGLSLDGYMAPEGMTMAHWGTSGYKEWGAKWGAMMGWLMAQQSFRENHGFGPGGETGNRQISELMPSTAKAPIAVRSGSAASTFSVTPRRGPSSMVSTTSMSLSGSPA